MSRNPGWREERRRVLALPSYTIGEEIANAITHGLGAALAAVGAVVLMMHAPGDALSLASAGIYSLTMFLLYLVSTLYHSLEVCKAKKIFQVLDHCTIYLLIAGTYTPISLLCIGGQTGWLLAGIVWTAGVIGIVLNAINMKKFRVVSMICYLAMGWCVLFFLPSLLASIDSLSLVLLV
ncbi:MAG: hemolysin III family protein, partial [Hydrogeniiclostridium sp.]